MATQHWNIDRSHSGVHFTVRYMVSKVRGAFTTFWGSIDFDPEAPAASRAEVTIDAASIDTHEPQRDEHLRAPDFLDVTRFPTLSFASTQVEEVGAHYRVAGEMTLHGVTRPVVMEVEALGRGKDQWGNERIGFAARTSINRKDFGLGWNVVLEAGGVLLGETVDIELDVQAVKARAEERAAAR